MTTRPPLRIGITLRTLLIFAVPLLLTILALGYHFTSTYIDDVRRTLDAQGAFLAKHLAALSEFGIYSQDIGELRKNADSMLLESNVVNVTIKNRHGATLVSTVNEDLLYAGQDTASFSEPVMRSGVDVSDFAEPPGEASVASGNPIGSVMVILSEADTLAKQDRILYTGITFTAVGIALSLLLAFVVARTITDPVVRLTNAVRELTSGNLQVRVREQSAGELGMLEHGINQMASSLQGSRELLLNEVNDATAALQATVIELENRNHELDRARDEALRAGAARSEFLARMSHEIRTPLSAVIGFAKLLDTTPQSDLQVEYTRTITQAASQLLQIIDDILDFTRLDSTSMRIEHAPFDLQECLENIVSILSKSAHDRQLELVLLVYSDVPRIIVSDKNRVSQILTNLVANAIKFTDSGHVVVNVSVADSSGDGVTLSIAVTDTGIGLTDSQMETIFDPFTQADVSTSRKYGGTGLGLSISKRLIDLLGGDISVDSAPRKGTTFMFTLPAGLPMDVELPARQSLDAGVLIYDSNPFALRALRNRFVAWGATVFNTQDVDRLMAMLGTGNAVYDLLVYGLPASGSDRASIEATVHRIRETSDIPLLLLVGSDIETGQTDNIELDDVCILSKPPRSERILRNIRVLLESTTPAGQPAMVSARTPAATTPTVHDVRVLIAEDNRYNQALFRHLLQDIVREVVIAGDGSEAVKLAEASSFDIIFMDLHMPVMGGIEAAREIRRLGLTLPIIALTADVMAVHDGKIDRDDMNDYLHKPVSREALIATLVRWCDLPDSLLDSHSEELRKTVELMPDDFIERLHHELHRLLDNVRRGLMEESRDAVREELHQIKGIAEYYQMDEFQSGFRLLLRAVNAGDAEEALVLLDRLDSLLEPAAEP